MLNNEILGQYYTVKSNVGLFDFSIEGKIIVKGHGRVDFINGLVSNDVENLESFNGVYASFLDRNGKILSDCIVYKFDDFLFINLSIIGKNSIIKKLNGDAALGKSEVEDATLRYALFSLQGPKSTELINNIFKSKIELQSQYQSIIIETKNNDEKIDILIMKNNRTNFDGYDIYVPASNYKEFKELIINNGKDDGLKIINNETYNVLRIEAKIPLFGVDFDEKNILPEVTEKAMNYDKGCFVGQEIVARVKNIAKGATAKKLRLFEIDSNDIPEKNAKIMAGNDEVGHVTSAAFSPNLNKAIGFGFVNKGFYDDGTIITINNAEATVKRL
ncbi:aminomethyl transferase family protein [Candidatus Woesearchaeota archaeon]|nr:aminomethyl transferase family protein [Candidatus Woesearchaeota archaeon]